MKFHEYISGYMQVKARGLYHKNYQNFYRESIALALNHNYNIGKNQFVAELWWHQADRPYYCLWPAVIPMFLRLKLDIDSGMILPPKQPLALRLPIEHNVLKFEFEGVFYYARAILFNEALVRNTPGITVWIDFGEFDEDGAIVLTFQNFQIKEGQTIEEVINALPQHDSAKMGVILPKEFVLNCIRLVCVACLLGDDPTLITPDVLNSDWDKWEKTHDEKYVEKAHRRHKIGWHIGKNIEVMPHFRRPHFAWYHTGPGGNIPQLIMRTGEGPSGTIEVHRRMIEKIPTGYMDREKYENS